MRPRDGYRKILARWFGLPRRCAIRALEACPPRWRDRAFAVLSHRVSDEAMLKLSVSQRSTLRHLAHIGYRPNLIIDVGAFVGDWTALALQIFPGLPALMIDGNPSRRADLEARARLLGHKISSEIALLGAESGRTIPFYEIGTGSSAYRELTSFGKRVHELPLHRLDDVAEVFVDRVGVALDNVLLKIDVQGYELEVLAGSPNLLVNVTAVVIELSLIQYNEGAPLAHEIIAFLCAAGFVIFDICELHRRDTDGSLFQVDLLFVRESSPLRDGSFWLAEKHTRE